MKQKALIVAGLIAGSSAFAGPAPVADGKTVDAKAVASPEEVAKPRFSISVGVDYARANLSFSRDAWNPGLKKPHVEFDYEDEILVEVPALARDVFVPFRAFTDTSTDSSRSGGDFDFGSREESLGPVVTFGYTFARTRIGDFGLSLGYIYHQFDISNKETTGKAKYSETGTSYFDFEQGGGIQERAVPNGATVVESETKTYRYKRTESGSFDVSWHSIPLLFNHSIGTRVADRALNFVMAVGPTLDIVNWDLDHDVKWKASGGGKSKSRHSSGSGRNVSIGLFSKLGVQYSFDTQDRWYIEADVTHRIVDGFTASAGDAQGSFDADGFGAQASIGFRF
jgi:hypothetical protein